MYVILMVLTILKVTVHIESVAFTNYFFSMAISANKSYQTSYHVLNLDS
jgi:hypothetical protein